MYSFGPLSYYPANWISLRVLQTVVFHIVSIFKIVGMFLYSIRAAVLQYPSAHNCTSIILQQKLYKNNKALFVKLFGIFFSFISFRRQCFKPCIYLNMFDECTKQATELFHCWATDSRKTLKAEQLKSAIDTCGSCRSLWGLWWWLLTLLHFSYLRWHETKEDTLPSYKIRG